MRAQIRLQVVKQLEEEKKKRLGSAAKYIKPLSLTTTRKVVGTEDGLLLAELMREFFQFYKMEHTLSVFEPEMSMPTGFAKSRQELGRTCGLFGPGTGAMDDGEKPLLLHMLERVRSGDYAPQPANTKQGSPGTDEMSNSPNQMRPHFQPDQEQQHRFVD